MYGGQAAPGGAVDAGLAAGHGAGVSGSAGCCPAGAGAGQPQGVVAALAIMLLYGLLFRAVLRGVDWLLLLVFMLMFVDLGLLAGLPQTDVLVAWLLALPGGVMTASVVVSQFISNVPATILLASF